MVILTIQPIKKLPIFRELSVPSYLASQQLQNIRLYLCDFTICTALVFPLPCTQAALDINLAAFLEVLARNLG